MIVWFRGGGWGVFIRGLTRIKRRFFSGVSSALFWAFQQGEFGYNVVVIRAGNKSRSFKEAEEWNRRQYREMSPNERIAASRVLRRKVYGPNPPDVRSWHRAGK
jgi:hypothetical protein